MTLKHTAGLHPCGRAILVEPYEATVVKQGSRIVIPESIKERAQMLEDRAVVLELGAACWIDEPEHRAKVGDKIYMPPMAGKMVKGQDGKMYRLINDKDVIATIEED